MSINIQFVSDYVCPFCYINKIFLEEACKGRDVHITYLPYELTPETQTPVDVCHDPVRRANWQKTIAPVVRAHRLSIKLPPKVSPRPYTRLAHEGYFYALDHEKGALYNDRIYQAYFSEEADIGDPQVLERLAKETGLDADDFAGALRRGTCRAQFLEAKDAAAALSVTTLPTIRIGGLSLNGGIHSPEAFEALLEKAQREPGEETAAGPGCGIDSCSF